MEDQFIHSVPGQEVTEGDLNLFATEAALADDRVFAELLRLTPTGSPVTRGILTSSWQQYVGDVSAVVVPSGSGDARVIINPFRALIAPTAPVTGKDYYREIRSALCVGTGVGEMRQFIQLAANPSNYRWDLIYVRLDVEINGPTVNRFVKTASTAAIQQAIPVTKQTTATLGVVQGTASATPAKPALPSDSGSSYYIPLAYVWVGPGHTLTTSITAPQIDETAPVLHLAPATGAASLTIANGMNAENGTVLTYERWVPGSGRPTAYLPPTMCGKRELFIALTEGSGTFSSPQGGTGVIDSTIDWRKRVFKVTAMTAGMTPAFPWTPGGSPFQIFAGLNGTLQGIAASFNDGAGVSTTGKAYLVRLSPSSTGATTAAGSGIDVYVDLVDGQIKCDVSATSPERRALVWLEATGQYNNAF